MRRTQWVRSAGGRRPVCTRALSTPRISFGEAKLAVSVHVLGMTVVRGQGVPGGWVYQGCTRGGYTGWVHGRVLHSALHWYCQGPTSAMPVSLQPCFPCCGPSRPALRMGGLGLA